jgi:hypothetical protein
MNSGVPKTRPVAVCPTVPLRGVEVFDDAEVEDAGPEAGGLGDRFEQEVVRLEIPVDEAGRVRLGQAVRELRQQLETVLGTSRTSRRAGSAAARSDSPATSSMAMKSAPLGQLARCLDANRHRVRPAQTGGRAGLTAETPDHVVGLTQVARGGP